MASNDIISSLQVITKIWNLMKGISWPINHQTATEVRVGEKGLKLYVKQSVRVYR